MQATGSEGCDACTESGACAAKQRHSSSQGNACICYHVAFAALKLVCSSLTGQIDSSAGSWTLTIRTCQVYKMLQPVDQPLRMSFCVGPCTRYQEHKLQRLLLGQGHTPTLAILAARVGAFHKVAPFSCGLAA